MPRNATIDIASGEWVELTDANTTAITFMVTGGIDRVYIMATATASAPTDLPVSVGAFPFRQGEGLENKDPASVFPGVTGAARIWAYSDKPGRVTVSHA